jgi:hypothetical protein
MKLYWYMGNIMKMSEKCKTDDIIAACSAKKCFSYILIIFHNFMKGLVSILVMSLPMSLW